MKAILLAGGKGTRLRPLTIHTPKPIVPIFNRPFLHYQIDQLRQVPEVDEVILSLNYQPRRIEEVFGEGEGLGLRVRYVVEPQPLGTGGAIRYAAQGIDDTLVVFNGDVMTSVDVNAVVRLHRERKAKATIVLTPVDNPTAYGLVRARPFPHERIASVLVGRCTHLVELPVVGPKDVLAEGVHVASAAVRFVLTERIEICQLRPRASRYLVAPSCRESRCVEAVEPEALALVAVGPSSTEVR